MFDFLRKGASAILNKPDPTVEEMLDQEDLADDLSPSLNAKVGSFVSQHHRQLVDFSTKVISESQAAANVKLATLYPKNATELLAKYVTLDSDSAIPSTVPVLLQSFKVRGVVHSVVAQNVSRVVVSAFTEDFNKTTEAFDECLSDAEFVHCLIRQIACSSTVGDLALSILGNALTSSESITIPPAEMFAAPWIKHNVHAALCVYVKVAMAQDSCAPYFAFMTDLFQRGLSPHIGHLVDHIIAKCEDFIVSIIEAAEEAARTPDSFPLIADGIGVLTAMVSMLQKASLSQTTPDEEDYCLSLRSCSALRILMRELPRLLPLLQSDLLSLRPNSLGLTRLRIVELCMALHRCNRQDSDKCLFEIQFPNHLIALAERFPTHDVLLSLLCEIVCDSMLRTFDKGALENHLAGQGRLYNRLLTWAHEPRFANTSLRALTLSTSHTMGEKRGGTVPSATPPGDAQRWSHFILNEIEELCGRWFAPITGDSFTEVGSGSSLPVKHREVVNLVHANPADGWGSSLEEVGSPTMANEGGEVESRGSRYATSFDDDNNDELNGMITSGPQEWNDNMFDDDPPQNDDENNEAHSTSQRRRGSNYETSEGEPASAGDESPLAEDGLRPGSTGNEIRPGSGGNIVARPCSAQSEDDEVMHGDDEELDQVWQRANENRKAVEQIGAWNEDEEMPPPPPPDDEDDDDNHQHNHHHSNKEEGEAPPPPPREEEDEENW